MNYFFSPHSTQSPHFLPRLRSQTETRYVQTGPDGKCLCPDRPRLKVPMSRPSQTESGYVQTFVRFKFFVRFSCVRRQICPDHPRPKQYMSRLSCVLVQTIVRSNSNSCVQRQIFRAFMSRPSCVHVQTIMRSNPDHRAFMSRLSCVHQTEKKLHPGVQCYSLKMKTERVPKFHKSICLRFIKKLDFQSLFL